MGSSATDYGLRFIDYGRSVLPVLKTRAEPMIAGLLSFIFTPIGRWAAISAMVLAAWFGFARHYEKKGAASVTAKIEQKVTQNVKKADDVRRSVQSLPAERLRDQWSRD